MPEDRIDVTVNTGNSFDAFQRLGVAQDRLAAGGVRIGESFVRGERAVRVASQNISAALLSAGDATSTFLIAASGLERVFKVGIGPTIAVAAGIKAFEFLHESVKKVNDDYKDLKEELAKPLNTDTITQKTIDKIDELTKKIQKLKEEAESKPVKASGIFAGLSGILGSALLPSFLQSPLNAALSSLTPPGPAQIAAVTKAGAQTIKAIADEGARKLLRAADKLSDAIEKTAAKFETSAGQLFRDIGSGQFTKDLQQRNTENLQTQQGQAMVQEFEDALARGETLGPNATAMVNAARALSARSGFGVEDLLKADFSNLDVLSKYDFGGLAPLSGFQVIVQ